MARGFESKSVADQQEEAQAIVRAPRDPFDPLVSAKRRRLELSLADVRHKIEGTGSEGHREMLRRAEAALEKELSGLK
ncbi:MAG TPA: hypothetical protein VI589_12755 [Vicinamibacteria bacterium]